jgi:hypothetical protein
MLIDLQFHYLDMIVEGIEEAGHACLLHKHAANVGRIYVTASATNTVALMVVSFDFQDSGAKLGVEFRDGREPFAVSVSYVEGLGKFLVALMQALKGNRIAYKAA